MDDEHEPVRRALVENENYLACSEYTEKLAVAMRLTKMLNSGGQGFVLEARLLKAAKQALLLGVETVSITYALFKLTVEVPKLGSIFQRRQKVDELRAALKERGTGLGSSLDALATKLATTKHG